MKILPSKGHGHVESVPAADSEVMFGVSCSRCDILFLQYRFLCDIHTHVIAVFRALNTLVRPDIILANSELSVCRVTFYNETKTKRAKDVAYFHSIRSGF